jgi:hypothetical protein
MNKNMGHSGKNVIHERSSNILIPSSPTNKTEYNEYSLKQNFFDPSKSSPPNEFLIKLQQRMDTYSKFCKKDEMRNSE